MKWVSAWMWWLLADLGLAGLFLYAGLIKAWPPGSLAESIAAYQVLPARLVLPLAHLLPWWEIVWSLALLSRRWVVPARLVLVGLLLAYSSVAWMAWMRSLQVTCGCFGGEGGGPGQVILRNLLIFGVLMVLWGLGCRSKVVGKENDG